MKRTLAAAACMLVIHGSALGAETPFITGIMDSMREAAASWGARVFPATWYLFWSLCLVNIVWNVGSRYIMHRVAIDSLFMEFTRLIIITGFFAFLLTYINDIAYDIIDSLMRMGTAATGGKAEYRVTEIFSYGLKIMEAALNKLPKLSMWDKAGFIIGSAFDEAGVFGQLSKHYDAITALLLVFFTLVIICVICSYIIMQLIGGYVLCYGGAFFLGFAGMEQTRPIAINYIKTIIIIGLNLFAIMFFADLFTDLVGPGLERMANKDTDLTVQQMLFTVTLAIITVFLTVRIPMLIGSVVNGAGAAAQLGAEFSAFRLAWSSIRLAAKVTPKTAAIAEGLEAARKGVEKLKDKGKGSKLERGAEGDAKKNSSGGGKKAVAGAVKNALKGKGR